MPENKNSPSVPSTFLRRTVTWAGLVATSPNVGPRGAVCVERPPAGEPPKKIAFRTQNNRITITTIPAIFTYLKTTAGSGPVGSELPVRGRCGPRFAGEGSRGASGGGALRSVDSV